MARVDKSCYMFHFLKKRLSFFHTVYVFSKVREFSNNSIEPGISASGEK